MPKTDLICANCEGSAQGRHGIHRDGFCKGPEVPLCNRCGEHETPTLEAIWANIANARLREKNRRKRAEREARKQTKRADQ